MNSHVKILKEIQCFYREKKPWSRKKKFPTIFQYYDKKNNKIIGVRITLSKTAKTLALTKSYLSDNFVAFTEDNYKPIFGRTHKDEKGKNVFAKFKKLLQNKSRMVEYEPNIILTVERADFPWVLF